MRVLVLFPALALLAGCALVDLGKDRASDRYASSVHGYCERVSDSDQEALRERSDVITSPHRVRVYCDE